MNIKKRFELAEKKYKIKLSAEMLCPKFDYCDVNKCPLVNNFKKLENTPPDKSKCKCPKTIRKQIGEEFKLKNRGLKEKELVAIKRWEALSPKEQEGKRQELRDRFKIKPK